MLAAATTLVARNGARGLRVEQVAALAGVSVALVYYHFGSRTGLLEACLHHVSTTAGTYTAVAEQQSGLDPGEQLLARLCAEFVDDDQVRDTSTAWGELRWTAVFEEHLRPVVVTATRQWSDEISGPLMRACAGPPDAPADGSGRPLEPVPQVVAAAERLTALVEGLSTRWLTGGLTADACRQHLQQAVALEVSGLRQQAGQPAPVT